MNYHSRHHVETETEDKVTSDLTYQHVSGSGVIKGVMSGVRGHQHKGQGSRSDRECVVMLCIKASVQ